MFYYRQLDWQEAAREYRRLGEFFPQSSHLREDKWRLAWCDYLLADAKTPDAIRQFLTAFPDSSHAPAALYWWGRIQEEQGVLSEARAIYAVLAKRFVHSYYAPKAAARLDALHAQAGNPSGASDSTSAPQAAALTSMLASPVAPASLACLATTPTEAARPALILRALDLKDVEGDFLRGALSGNNPPAELRLLLAELYATQNNPSSALVGALKIAPAYPQMEFSVLPKEVWDFLYPHTYWPLVQRQARLNKVDPYLVMGLIRQESAFNKGALSVANARGLMQLLPETAAHSTRRSRTRTAARRLNDPAYNVRSGCAYLAALLKMFDGRPEYALAAYNAGDFRVKDWTAKYSFRDSTIFLESIPIPATRSYVELVLRDAEVYRQLLTGSAHFAVCPLERASAPAHQAGVATRPHVPAGPVARPAPQH
jgi:soluble lytic murein transglycosylase